jgi:hypothetical protein
MKVTISVEVMKGGWAWDEKVVKKEMFIEADDVGVLIPATIGAIKGLEQTITDAVLERQQLLLLEESNANN